jgi:hypothetical protein
MGTTLDIAIGLISVYLLLSVLCSAIYEALAGVFRLRAVNLAKSIDMLLVDRALEEQVMPLIAAVKSPRRGFFAQLDAYVRRKLKLKRARPQSPLAVALRQHPLMKTLKHGWIGPSYIPSHTFVAALVDTLRGIDWSAGRGAAARPEAADAGAGADGGLAPGGGCAADREADPLGELKSVIARLPSDSDLKRALCTILDGTVKDANEANARLERWFNDTMDRAAGRYKRYSQLIIAASALVLCVGFNVDTVAIANALSRDAAVRATVLAAAQNMAKAPPGGAVQSDPAQGASASSEVLAALAKGGVAHQELAALDLKITWGGLKAPEGNSFPSLWAALGWLLGDGRIGWARGLLARLFSPGVLITSAAAALGAPFWFDLLNKLVNLRTAGKSPEPGS